MVKNLKGGSGHKNLARKNVKAEGNQYNVRMKTDSLEHYAFVEKNLGNGHLDVLCDDQLVRRCMIPGKFKKHKRNNLITLNGFILVGEYEFETTMKDKMQKCSLLETYSEQDYKEILDKSANDDKLYSFLHLKRNSTVEKMSSYVDDGFDFSENAGKVMQESNGASAGGAGTSSGAAAAAAFADDDFDFDAI